MDRHCHFLLSFAACAVAFVSQTSAALAEDSVSLSALWDAARQTNPSLQKRALLERSLSVQNDQLDIAYYPQLSVGGSATWQSEVTRVQVPVPGVSIDPPPKDQYKLTLNLQQNLWDFGATSDRKRVAETGTRVQEEQAEVEWQKVRERILQLYFAGVVQQQLQAQAKALEGYLETTVDKAEVALEQGVVTERDVLLVRARKLEARRALVDAETQLKGIREGLTVLTGRELSAGDALAAPEINCEDAPKKAVSAAALKRPDLDLLEAQRTLLDAKQEAEESPDRPRLGAFATGGYGRPGLNMLSRNFEFYFIGGLQVTIPLTYLYAGTHRKARSQLSIQRSLVDKQEDALMVQVNAELASYRADVERLDAAVALDAELLELREGARKQVETQLALGTATMTDLLSDLGQEEQARTQLAIHRHQRSLACHQIAMTLGKL